jgi:hypothetical protein
VSPRSALVATTERDRTLGRRHGGSSRRRHHRARRLSLCRASLPCACGRHTTRTPPVQPCPPSRAKEDSRPRHPCPSSSTARHGSHRQRQRPMRRRSPWLLGFVGGPSEPPTRERPRRKSLSCHGWGRLIWCEWFASR